MTRKRDRESGRYENVYSDEDILSVIRGTRLATTEVADELNCHRTTAHDKLRNLENKGLVESSHAGNTLIWEVTENGS